MPLATQPVFVQVVFWALSAVAVISALLVISLQDIFKAALALVLSLLSVAGLFILLNAEFLAAAQVLIYVGAIAILIIFAVMLTQNVAQGNPSNKFRIPMALGVSLFAVFIIIAITGMDWNLITEANLASATQDAVNAIVKDNPAGLASILLNNYVLPFEAVSLLLLAAVIGAIVLVRER